MIDAIVHKGPEDDATATAAPQKQPARVGHGKKLILIDHEDSFVHTLGNYLRQTGATVMTLRSGPSALKALETMVQKGEKPDLVCISRVFRCPWLPRQRKIVLYLTLILVDRHLAGCPLPRTRKSFRLWTLRYS